MEHKKYSQVLFGGDYVSKNFRLDYKTFAYKK